MIPAVNIDWRRGRDGSDFFGRMKIIVPHQDKNPLFQAFDAFAGLRHDGVQEVETHPVGPEIEARGGRHYFPAIEDDGWDDGFPGAE
jgi:hypothetical protein